MVQFVKKENLTISVGEYIDKNTGKKKQQYKTIGELVTMQGDDGPFQFFKLWGAGGVIEGKVFEQQDRNQQAPQQQVQQQNGGVQQQNQHPPANFEDDLPFN